MNTLLRHFTLALLCICTLGQAPLLAQSSSLCLSGLHWRATSAHSAWGKGHPVVQAVRPYSMAERAGLRVGDLILRIGDVETSQLTPVQISALLEQDSPQLITYHRLDGQTMQGVLGKECKSSTEINERELAELFALYSLEDSSLETTTYPFVYQVSPELSLHDVHTFSFAPSSTASQETDSKLNALIATALSARGLKAVETQGDLIVSTHYSLQRTGLPESEGREPAFGWRLDPQAHIFTPVPIVTGAPSLETLAQYKLTLGIILQKRRMPTQHWQVESSEYLSDGMSIEDYARLSIPVMLHSFPSAPSTKAGLSYDIQTLRYFYTGLSYTKGNLSHIVDVAQGSPAWRAGLRPGDRIKAINGIRLRKEQTEDILEDYFALMEQTDRYRMAPKGILGAPASQLKARYWAPGQYSAIAHALSRGRSEAAFAYIFAFRPYISSEAVAQIIFEIERRGEQHSVLVSPILRDETTIIPH